MSDHLAIPLENLKYATNNAENVSYLDRESILSILSQSHHQSFSK